MSLYRLLLFAFSKRTRVEFGDEMMRLFRDQRQDARTSGQSMARFWLSAIADAAAHGSADRYAAARGAIGARLGTRNIDMTLPRSTEPRPSMRWRWWMHALLQDLRYALRLMRKQPGVTLVVILTLALGIGANTAIFSAVNAVLLRPLPYADPERLMMVWEKRPTEGVLDNVVSPADFLDWVRMQSAFEAIAALTTVTADFTGAGEPVRLSAGAVSTPFFDILRVRPILGRNFRTEEGVVGQHRVVILSHGLWQDRLGSDPNVVGRKIALNGVPHEVVGVLPAAFEFPDKDLSLWSPLALAGTPQPPTRTNHFLEVYGRLKPGVTLDQARADMDRVGLQLQQQYPEANRNHSAHVVRLADELRQPVRTGLMLLLGAVAFVLLIACVNVANLLLAKAVARRREMAVRAALGAGRLRLAGQTMTESLVLGLLGGCGGLLVAYWGIDLIRALAPADVKVLGRDQLGLDPFVLTFALVLSVVTGLLFGVLPAWHLASQDVNDSLKDGGRSPSHVRRRLRVALVVSEIALASLLLVGAGLTLRSFQTLLHTEPGFTRDGVLTAFVALPAARYRGDPRVLSGFDEIERRFAALPGVRGVGGTSHLPLTGQDSRGGVAIEGREPTPDAPTRAHPRAITLDYFRTMGIPLKAGRNFTEGDHSDAPFVVIVNETMARRYWPDASPIGKRLRMGGSAQWREVVGVVADVKHWGLERPVNPELYLPQRQMVWQSLNFVLATSGDPGSIAGAVRQQLREVDPDLPLSNVRTMEEVAARSVATRRSGMILLAIFGGLALVLAAAGIYAVMAHLVALRSSEIGIRMTLGARPSDVMRLVLREGVVQAAGGVAVGLTAGVILMRSFRTMLYEISPADPLTLAAVSVLLVTVALAACVIPARRAMRVDPMEALRGS